MTVVLMRPFHIVICSHLYKLVNLCRFSGVVYDERMVKGPTAFFLSPGSFLSAIDHLDAKPSNAQGNRVAWHVRRQNSLLRVNG